MISVYFWIPQHINIYRERVPKVFEDIIFGGSLLHTWLILYNLCYKKIIMAVPQLTQERKKHVIILVTKTKHSDFEIS